MKRVLFLLGHLNDIDVVGIFPDFESALCQYTGAKYAVAVNSATSALHIACLALGLGEGDWLWTSPITFVASANCALYCGAQVDFVDIDPLSFNMCPLALKEKLIKAERLGCLPKIVVVVHLAGLPCDMRAIKALSETYGFKIIEDASHAVGASYLDEPVGRGAHSDVTVFSFHPVKIITSAEGGMALTNDEALATNMSLYRSHGITRDDRQYKQSVAGPWYYEQIELGFNYRMSDVHAALGLSQLKRLDEFIGKRMNIAQWYIDQLQHLPLNTQKQSTASNSAWHLFIIQLHLQPLKKTHRQIFEELRACGLGVNVHYIPVYKQPYYQNPSSPTGIHCPNAERYYDRAISIPMFPSLTLTQMEEVVHCLENVLAN